MGIFMNKKKKQELEPINDDGWKAIEEAFAKVYPGQEERKHYGVLIPWMLGGPDPLDGISIYDGGDCWHFVTFGLSELYEKQSQDKEFSGYGMEFTMRLKKGCYAPENEENEIKCVVSNLQNIAKLTFQNGELFLPWEYIYTGQKDGIDFRHTATLNGFITVPDTKVPPITTPNGKLEFVEFIGATDAELLAIQNKQLNVKGLFEKIGDVTDYLRPSVV